MRTTCPYNKKVICAYLEHPDNSRILECDDCTHYRPGGKTDSNPLEGAKAIGCLFVGVAFLIMFLFIAAMIIKTLRDDKTKKIQETHQSVPQD